MSARFMIENLIAIRRYANRSDAGSEGRQRTEVQRAVLGVDTRERGSCGSYVFGEHARFSASLAIAPKDVAQDRIGKLCLVFSGPIGMAPSVKGIGHLFHAPADADVARTEL